MNPYSDLPSRYLEFLDLEIWIARSFRMPLNHRALLHLLESR